MSGYDGQKAAALSYQPGEDAAPVVVAAGSGYIAEKIFEIAEECGIAVYRDDSAAALLSRLGLGAQIPPEFYRAVAEIYLAVLSAADHAL